MDMAHFPALKAILPQGIPKGDQILVSGAPGSGKTILAMQFICEGIEKGENGIFFSLESDRDYLISQMKGMGINARNLIEQGKLDIVVLDPKDVYLLLDQMAEHVKRINAGRIVIDSLSVLSVYCGSYRNLPEDLVAFLDKVKIQPPIALSGPVKKQMLYGVMSEIRKLGCTTLLTSELPRNSKWYSRDTISEFACDGIILLEYHVLGAGGATRTISVVKMRRGACVEGVHKFHITGKGIKVEVPS